MSSLDPRDPLVFDIRDLGRRAGSMVEVDRTVPAPADLGAGVAVVPAGSDLGLDLRFEAVVEGVLVSGTASVTVIGECARCLDPVTWDETVPSTELYLHEPGPETSSCPSWTGTSSASSRSCATPWCWPFRWRRCVVPTAPGCAWSVVRAWPPTRRTRTTRRSPVGSPRRTRHYREGRLTWLFPSGRFPLQHPCPAFAVEGGPDHPRDLRPLPLAEAAAHRVPHVRHVRQAQVLDV